MSVAGAKKVLEISQSANPKLALINAVGDLSNESVLSDLVLVATYIRPEKTMGGIIRPTDNIKEDEYQGKVGLVLKMGPQAGEFDAENNEYMPNYYFGVGDWVAYGIKDGIALTIRDTPCRLIPYQRVRMKISSPDVVF